MAKITRVIPNQYRRKRLVIAWQPSWTPKIESWTAKQIHNNLWRFDTVTDKFDDVMQEAQILFWILSKTYPIVNNPNHFFALYKTSLLRKFHDKARIRQNDLIDQSIVAEELADQLESNLQNYGYLSLLLEELPDELKIVLGSLTSGRVRVKLDRPTSIKRPRENHNMRLKRQLSLETSDPVSDLRSYFINS